MNKIKQRWSAINHKELWVDSMIGMTWGFIASLVVGTIVGIFAIGQNNTFFNQIHSIKNVMTYITPFAIGVGIAYKAELKPLQVMAVMLGVGISAHSSFIPSIHNGMIVWKGTIGLETSLFKPGDVFGAWIAGVLWIYIFKLLVWDFSLDIILLPLMGVIIGFIDSLYLTYLTSTLVVLMEWVISHSIDKERWIAILLAPVVGLIMGIALSLPTSSAAIAIALKLHGDAATAAMAATAAQMVTFGVMTYFGTKNISKALTVGLGTSMLQMKNFSTNWKILFLPAVMSILMALLATVIVPLDFVNSDSVPKPTAGMGSCALYGQIFTLEDNGWTNSNAWIHVLVFQLGLPFVLSIGASKILIKKNGFINPKELVI